MKPVTMAALAALVPLIVLAGGYPAWAVSEEVRTACLIEAFNLRPRLDAAEVEAYVANCIADLTATKGRKG